MKLEDLYLIRIQYYDLEAGRFQQIEKLIEEEGKLIKV